MKVQVYFNLHKKLWSIKALEGEQKGKVIKHQKNVVLLDVKPKVSEAGRQRVLREKCKNVHAGLVGTLVPLQNEVVLTKNYAEITYNPYRYSTFVYKNNEKEYKGSKYASLTTNGVYVSC